MVVIDFYTRRLLGPKEISDRAAYQPQELDYDYPLVDDRDDIDEHAFDHRNLNEMYPHDDGDTGSASHDVTEYARWMAANHIRYSKDQTKASEQQNGAANLSHPAMPNRDLIRSAHELRAAAQRLRDLAGELRATRTRLQVEEHGQVSKKP
mgnify:CR=1 FL=1